MKEEQKEEEKKKKVEQKMAQIEVKNEVGSHSRSLCTSSTRRVRCVRSGSTCSGWQRRRPRRKQLSSARRS